MCVCVCMFVCVCLCVCIPTMTTKHKAPHPSIHPVPPNIISLPLSPSPIPQTLLSSFLRIEIHHTSPRHLSFPQLLHRLRQARDRIFLIYRLQKSLQPTAKKQMSVFSFSFFLSFFLSFFFPRWPLSLSLAEIDRYQRARVWVSGGRRKKEGGETYPRGEI